MKKISLSLILLFAVLHALPQKTDLQKELQQLSNYPKQDTSYINKINDFLYLLTDLRNTSVSVQQRDSLASIALTIAKKINYTHGEIYAMIQLCITKSMLGNNEQALSIAQEAYNLAEQNSDREMQVKALLSMGTIKTVANPAAALEDFLKGEAIAETLPNKKLLSRSQRLIGGDYNSSLSNYPKAMEWLLKSIHTSESINDLSGLEASWQSMGDLYNVLGDYQKSTSYYTKAMQAADTLGIKDPNLQNSLGENYRLSGRYPEAIIAYKKGLAPANTTYMTELYQSNLADVYVKLNDLPSAFSYAFMSLSGAQKINDVGGIAWIDNILARTYLKNNQADSAIYYAAKGLHAAKQSSYLEFLRDNCETLSDAYAQKKDFEKAYNFHLQYITYRDSMVSAQVSNQANLLQYDFNMEKTQAQIVALNAQKKNQRNILFAALIVLALIIFGSILLMRNNRQKRKANRLLQQQKQEIDEKATELARQKTNLESLEEIGHNITSSLSVENIISTAYNNVNTLMDANVFGVGIYNDALKRIDFPATYEAGKPLPFYTNVIDDKNRFAPVCFNNNKEIIIGDLSTEYKNYIQSIQTPRAGEQPLSLIFLPLIAKGKKLGVLTVQSFQKNAYTDYHLYMLRNIAIYTAIALENASSYEELKSTQAQLVQSEKMASLGELTAGIAHEIQNPLNFVNNFSEVNNELINDMNGENNIDEIKNIANDIKLNNEKILFHGKRADAIVKNMLQHSRVNSGKKESTDINALCDEYLRLAYHGLRAKDKNFNANFKTDFDNTVGKINMVSQDMGRVILNLINNAFYAVNEKQRIMTNSYQPMVEVKTRKLNDKPGSLKVEITVKDNGNGIPDAIKEKIFQPFFTTKPAGSGTGLGLSLSYDIIKAHGGEIKVETKEGEGSEFIIQLPA